jgi:hypothetical protein
MNGPRRSGPAPTEPEGERPAWRPSLGYLAVALAIAAAGLAYGVMWSSASTPGVEQAATPVAGLVAMSTPAPIGPVHAVAASSAAPASAGRTAPTARAAPSTAAQEVSRTRDPNGDQTPDLSDYLNKGEKPSMAEVIDRLHQAGVYTGLGAFNPPGTRPPLVGLAVPEDFVLPEGYVRHYQATDDGQRIEPILMFSPDYQFFDAAHRPIAIPKDRVVPPELAPPGLPIRRIVIPAPTEPGRPGS